MYLTKSYYYNDNFRQWKLDEEHELYEYYYSFVRAVVNVSYETMYNFTEFRGDKTLDGIDLLDLAIQVVYFKFLNGSLRIIVNF